MSLAGVNSKQYEDRDMEIEIEAITWNFRLTRGCLAAYIGPGEEPDLANVPVSTVQMP